MIKNLCFSIVMIFMVGCSANVMTPPEKGMQDPKTPDLSYQNTLASIIPAATLNPQIDINYETIEHQTPIIETSLKSKNLKLGSPVFIRIFKQENQLEIWLQGHNQYHLAQTYDICDYSGKLGPKLKEGDKQSPEGFYRVSMNDMNPNSKFHLSFDLGYPNRYDRSLGRTGKYLMVHGGCLSEGCYAMGDKNIEKIYTFVYSALAKGQRYVPVHVFPFRMTWDNMAVHQSNPWFSFWSDLKSGYDAFENTQIPPKIAVIRGEYQANPLYTMTDHRRYMKKRHRPRRQKAKIHKISHPTKKEFTEAEKKEAVKDLKETVSDLAESVKNNLWGMMSLTKKDGA